MHANITQYKIQTIYILIHTIIILDPGVSQFDIVSICARYNIEITATKESILSLN